MSVHPYPERQFSSDILPANGQDWANHMARFWSRSSYIQAVLTFDNRLDDVLLAQTIRLSIDAEPVLGCRFVDDTEIPVWQHISDADQMPWVRVIHSEDQVKAVRDSLVAEIVPDFQQLQVDLIHGEASDVLCVKLNHACSDAGGLKDYLALISETYTRLARDQSYRPNRNNGDRSVAKLLEVLGIGNPKMAYDPKQAVMQPTWSFPNHEDAADTLRFALRRFNPTAFASLHRNAHMAGATVNDVVLSAYYRSLFTMLRTANNDPMHIHVTVDLRRYLPENKAAAVCNLSGIAIAQVAKVENETPYETLARVAEAMQYLKKQAPGMHSAASMELMTYMRYSDAVTLLRKAWQACVTNEKASPILSNTGVIAPAPMYFGASAVTDAYLVTPAMHAPAFMLGTSTYSDVLTLSVGYFDSPDRQASVNDFLDLMQFELDKFV